MSGILAGDFALPFLRIVRAWDAERPALIAAYQRAQAAGDLSIFQAAVEAAKRRVAATVSAAQATMPASTAQVDRWHRRQWATRIKQATGIDVSMFVTAQPATSPELANAIAWNQSLAEDMHQQIAQRISGPAIGGFAAGAETAAITAVIMDAITKGRNRARNIAADQVEKISAGLSRARRLEAGLTSFRWRHCDPQKHPRPEHKARDGRIYTEQNAPKDRAGTLPFCKCWEDPVFD
jgi:uncharacterized protein with gpF-like domain